MTHIDRSRQAALEALRASAGSRLADRFIASAIDIAYTHQFSPDDRSSARRALRNAVLEETLRRQDNA